MKTIGLVILSVVIGIQLLVFGYQTYLAVDTQKSDMWNKNPFQRDGYPERRPSSIEELPKSGPIQELKYQILPDDFPLGNQADCQLPLKSAELN